MSQEIIEIYTDGACSGNPGKGGWGAILLYKEHQKEISGCLAQTTNNQMELMAVIEALKIVKKTIEIIIYTDSIYVKDGITKWIFNWKKNGWRTANKKPVKNLELWQELDLLAANHQITWKWVKGHSGNKYNEVADQLAVNAISQLSN
jgi:ribonuclease HI